GGDLRRRSAGRRRAAGGPRAARGCTAADEREGHRTHLDRPSTWRILLRGGAPVPKRARGPRGDALAAVGDRHAVRRPADAASAAAGIDRCDGRRDGSWPGALRHHAAGADAARNDGRAHRPAAGGCRAERAAMIRRIVRDVPYDAMLFEAFPLLIAVFGAALWTI